MRRRSTTAFIDWNSQISNAGQRRELRLDRQIQATIGFVADRLADILPRVDKSIDIFDVDVRLYYGWHRGLTATPSRVEFIRIIQNFQLPTTRGNARLNWKTPFGDLLANALPHRLQPKLRIHLPNTLRADPDGLGDREKMVDTALVCDVLCNARSDPGAIRIILAEDDDIVPVLFVSEHWTREKGGRTIAARSRLETGHLAVDGLIFNF